MSKSKIFLFFSSSFILGIGLAPYLNFSSFLKLFLVLAAVVIIFSLWPIKKLVVFGFCFVFFVFGLGRYDQVKFDFQNKNLASHNDKNGLLIEGKVIEEPDVRPSQIKLTIEAENLYSVSQTEKEEIKKELGKSLFYEDLQDLEKIEIQGKALLVLPRHPDYQYGDRVLVFGKLVTPKEDKNFSYKDYLSRYDIFSLSYYPTVYLVEKNQGNRFMSNLLKIKERFEKTINRVLPEPHASFLSGLILGAKKSIPKDLMEKFKITGTAHIVALSGYNISIIVAATSAIFFWFFSRRVSFWLSILAILIFVLLTGGQASCVRAAIMGGLVAMARYSGRLSNATNSLVFAGALMLFFNPKILAFDLSFQLSFLATLGIIYFMPYVEKAVRWLPEFFQIRESAAMTLSAQILVVPRIIFSFSRVSLISPLVNILILPVIPTTMFLGFLSGLLGQVHLFFGKIFGAFSYFFLNYQIAVVDYFSKIPFASLSFEKARWWGIWLYFGAVAAIFGYLKWKEKKRLSNLF